jgi:hypothetical protein
MLFHPSKEQQHTRYFRKSKELWFLNFRLVDLTHGYVTNIAILFSSLAAFIVYRSRSPRSNSLSKTHQHRQNQQINNQPPTTTIDSRHQHTTHHHPSSIDHQPHKQLIIVILIPFWYSKLQHSVRLPIADCIIESRLLSIEVIRNNIHKHGQKES